MLDLFGIVFSSTIMFLVILRAIQMDSASPWFNPPKTAADSSGLRLRPEDANVVGEVASVTTTARSRQRGNRGR